MHQLQQTLLLRLIFDKLYQTVYIFNRGSNGCCTWQFPTNDPYGWYTQNDVRLQLKIVHGVTDVMLDFSTTYPVNICQKIDLVPQRKYRLKYQIYTSQLNFTTIQVTINGQKIDSSSYNKEFVFFSHTSYFYAKSRKSEICFSGTPKPGPGNLDNNCMINQIKVEEAQYYKFQFYPQLLESQQTLLIKSNLPYNQTLAQQLISQYRIMVDQQVIGQCNYQRDQESLNMMVRIHPNISFWLRDIQFKLYQTSQRIQMIQIQFDVNHQDKYYRILSDEERKVLSDLQEGANFAKYIVVDILAVVRGSFCSYFLFGLLGFWNIGLLYIFLLFSVVPEYTREIYYELLTSLFDLGNIFIWMQNYLPIPDQFYKASEKLGIGSPIQASMQNYRWFGAYGFSTDILDNNYLNFLLLVLLLGKIFIVKNIRIYILQKWLKIDVNSKIKGRHMLAAEVTSLSPEFIISSLFCITKPAQNSLQNIHKGLQILVMFFCIFGMGIYTIHEYRKNHSQLPKENLKINKRKTATEKINQLMNQQTIKVKQQRYSSFFVPDDYFYQSCIILMMLTTPLLIILTNSLCFLIINLIVIGYRAYSFKKIFYKMSKNDKFFEFLKTVNWIIHHGIFIGFYGIENKDYQTGNAISNNLSLLNILGIGAIFTILFGGLVQIIHTLIKVGLFSAYVIRNLHKYWLKKRENQKSSKANSKQRKKIQKIDTQTISQKQEQIMIPATKLNVQAKSKQKAVQLDLQDQPQKQIPFRIEYKMVEYNREKGQVLVLKKIIKLNQQKAQQNEQPKQKKIKPIKKVKYKKNQND